MKTYENVKNNHAQIVKFKIVFILFFYTIAQLFFIQCIMNCVIYVYNS